MSDGQELVKFQMEDYVQQRVRQFAHSFAMEVVPDLPHDQLEAIVERILHQHAPAEPPTIAIPAPQIVPVPMPLPAIQQCQLEFRHDCLALGCRDAECALCQYNPTRVCERNFAKKYLVGDILKAKCGAPIQVVLTTPDGHLVDDPQYSQITFEVNLLDGVRFKDMGGETRGLSDDELRQCFRLANHKDEPLLQYKLSGGNTNGHRRVQVKLEGGICSMPDTHVTDSSEALLTGRRPPFRLIIWAMDEHGHISSLIRPAISEDFVVATRRVKQANKVEIPLVDDHVSKIEHIGRETIKKLADMRQAAIDGGVDIQIDERMARIETVGQFQNLVRVADTDAQLRKVLQIILKLSKEKWDEAAAHAMTAVVPDFRRRVWYPPGHNMGVGLVFNAKYGAVQLRDTICLAQTQPDGTIKVLQEDHLDPASLDILRDLKTSAVKKWHEPRHPGWGIFREPGEVPLDGAVKADSGSMPGGLPMVGMKRDASQAELDGSQYAASMPLDLGSMPVDAAQTLVGMQMQALPVMTGGEGVPLPEASGPVVMTADGQAVPVAQLSQEQLMELVQQGADPQALGLQPVDMGNGQIAYMMPQNLQNLQAVQIDPATLAAMQQADPAQLAALGIQVADPGALMAASQAMDDNGMPLQQQQHPQQPAESTADAGHAGMDSGVHVDAALGAAGGEGAAGLPGLAPPPAGAEVPPGQL